MNGEDQTITVFIVAASHIVRVGLESVLREKSEFVITGSVAEISAALPAFLNNQIADVILINIEREKDFENLIAFLNDSPDEADLSRFVALFPAEMQNAERAIRALQNGVRGILPHDATANEVVASVTAAANDLTILLPETVESLLSFSTINDVSDSPIVNEKNSFADEMVENLTPREMEILEMLADGASNKAIAYELSISGHTVKFHVASIFGKFGVNTRTEAVTQALRRGLILL